MKYTLRPLQPQDAQLFARWMEDEEMAECFRRKPPIWAPHGQVDTTQQNQWVVMDEAGQSIGACLLYDWDYHGRKVCAGILIEKAHRDGHNILKDLRDLLASYVFDYLEYNKMVFVTLAHRKALHKLLESLGARCEAVLTENVFWRGKFWDEVIHTWSRAQYNSSKSQG